MNGDLVAVLNTKNEILAHGHYYEGSIAVRVLKFGAKEIDGSFWEDKIKEALRLRKSLSLVNNQTTNAFRLINGEGDGLPGLIVDVYNKVCVIQCHTPGMIKNLKEIQAGLEHVLSQDVTSIYHKSKDTVPRDFSIENEFLKGDTAVVEILENGNKFLVDLIAGQKTGFFIDQRRNRKRLSAYVKNKKVLNTFCYTGGFSIYALNAGAESVVSVDASKSAIEGLNKNLSINNIPDKNHQAHVADVLEFLKINEDEFDLIILDPPAYAKSNHKKHKAVQAYKRLNALAIKKIKSGGLIFTFSCSKVIYPELFYNTIQAAAIEVGRNVKILEWLSQGPDHPVSIYHSEGKYLKGLVLSVT